MTPLKTFLVSYGFEGSQYSLEIVASDMDEAKARVKALAFAKMDGELMMKVKVPNFLERFLRAFHGAKSHD